MAGAADYARQTRGGGDLTGPLTELRIIELAGIGPVPFAGMMLADHGAEVIRVERPGAEPNPRDPLLRSRTMKTLDLKTAEGAAELRSLCKSADGLIEGFRPGVMERLGIGPDTLHRDNPKLVYGRMTGWGQDGPLAQKAGHDINFIALSGTLGALGRAGDKPTPPINLVGDFGGGGMLLAFGMVSALLAVKMGGNGQVVDCAMTDGSALLMAMMWGFRAQGRWTDERGTNVIDTGAPFYETYETADGLFVAVGAIEPQFYAELRRVLELSDNPKFGAQFDPAQWPAQKAELARLFKAKTRAEWVAAFDQAEACVTPVLSMAEALQHPHNLSRQTFVTIDGVPQPAPAPRFKAL
jgi:alpha-methylacyl-CoA racemase